MLGQPPYLWDLLLPFAPLITSAAVLAGAAFAYFGVLRTVRQKATNDERDQLWKRTQWAIDLTLQPDLDARFLGVQALQILVEDQDGRRKVETRDVSLTKLAIDAVIRALPDVDLSADDSEPTNSHTGEPTGKEPGHGDD